MQNRTGSVLRSESASVEAPVDSQPLPQPQTTPESPATVNQPDPGFDPKDYIQQGRLKIVQWFDTIRKSTARAEEALRYYELAVNDANPHITAVGHLETLVAETPGLEHFYKGILVDCQQIRRYLEEDLEINKAIKHKWFRTSRDAVKEYGEVGTNDATKWVNADESISRQSLLVRRFANAENHLTSIVEGFSTRGIMLSKIVDIRKANLQEVWIDPRKETRNV